MPGLLPRKYKDHRRYSFARTFGSAAALVDCDFDKDLWNPNQNAPETIFNNPPIYNGCSYYTRSDVAANEDGILYNPAFVGQKACLIENVPYGSPLPLEASFKAGIDYGLLALGETTDAQALAHRRGAYFEIEQGSAKDMFDAFWSAMLKGQKCLSVGTPWFPEFNNSPMVFSVDIRTTDDWHNWEACGVKTIDGVPMMKVKWWGGPVKYFSREAINALVAVKGADYLTDVNGKATSADIQTIRINILQLLISLYQRLRASFSA